MGQAFIFLLALLVRLLRAACKSKDELVLENLALRQQVTALKLGKHRPKLHEADRAFWIALRKSWANWASRLLIVKPGTVVDWPIITVTWLVDVPLVVVHVTAGFIMEALLAILLRRGDDSDHTDSIG